MINKMAMYIAQLRPARFENGALEGTCIMAAPPLRASTKTAATAVAGTIAALIICCTTGCGSTSKAASAKAWTISSADLRFQGVSSLPSTTPYEHTFQLGDEGFTTWPKYYGTPLELGNGLCGSSIGDPTDCAWGYTVNAVSATGFSNVQKYSSDVLTNLVSDKDFLATDSVVHSLDIEAANNVFATAATSTSTSSGFHSRLDHVALADISATVSEAGEAGLVVTALSLDSSSTAYVLSYSWDQDTDSIYDEVVKSVTYDSLETIAQQLASQGYVISAFGGNQSNGFYLVGTRLQGSTTPRSIVAYTVSGSAAPPASDFASGYAVVAILNDQTDANAIWLLEK